MSISSCRRRLAAATEQAARKVEGISREPGVQYTTSVIGFSLLSYVQTSYSAFFFVTLKPWIRPQKSAEQFQAINSA